MAAIPNQPQVVKFGIFEVDLAAGEVRKAGMRQKLARQPFQVLQALLEHPQEVVTREELRERLWPDNTFVDYDLGLKKAVNRLREVLGDSAENPRFIETLPRRGYRFIASITVNGTAAAVSNVPEDRSPGGPGSKTRARPLRALALLGAIILLGVGGFWIYKRRGTPATPPQSTLTRITFDEGLQNGPTWSPDGRYIAYSSDRGGKFDIWVQQVSGGNPVQITNGPGDNWSPNWSPDGKYIAYRSENGAGGLFVVPPLGGDSLEKKISSFGYHPSWSPDGSQILFQTAEYGSVSANRFYVVGLDGAAPHQVLADLTAQQVGVSAAWHPDGKRISVWTCDPSSYSIWTQPSTGGPAIKSEVSAEILHQRNEVGLGAGIHEMRGDFFFTWAPSGKVLFLEQTFRGTKNIWRMDVDPETLRTLSFKRLTTGAGSDTELALSRDGEKLAFTSETRHVRAWMYPFDANSGRLKGPGKAVTPSGRDAWELSLSPDGKNLAYRADHQGRFELWQTSLTDGRETLIRGDDFHIRNLPQWSPNKAHLAYWRDETSTGKRQLMEWSALDGEETPITEPQESEELLPYDWSPDGKSLLISQFNHHNDRYEIWILSVGPDRVRRRIAFDPAYGLFQPHSSPDGRWIVFEAARPDRVESTIFAMAATGGPWIPIATDGQWNDKPRWSPNGKVIYFVSLRNGFYNVYGLRFDPAEGKPIGSRFQVTEFKSPSARIPKEIMSVELAVSQDRLIVNVEQVSGNIWVLGHTDR